MSSPHMLRTQRAHSFTQQLTLEKKNIRLALQLYWRNRFMVLITSLTITIALAFPSALLIAARNFQQLAGNWEVDLHIQLFLDKSISSTQRQSLIQTISQLDSVQSYTLVSADEALQALVKESNFSEVISVLEDNPLPDVILIRPISQHEDLLADLLVRLASIDGVQEAFFDQKWANTLVTFFDLLNFFTSFILQLLLVGLFVLIAGNVNAIIARSHTEIQVIKLIGASDAFVSRPYIYFGGMIGITGGVSAFCLVVFMLWQISDALISLTKDYNIEFIFQRPAWYELLFLALGPLVLGMFAAMLSCRSAIARAMPRFAQHSVR